MADIPQNIWMLRFYEEELEFEQGLDDLGDVPEAEASYYSLHGYLPGARHWPRRE